MEYFKNNIMSRTYTKRSSYEEIKTNHVDGDDGDSESSSSPSLPVKKNIKKDYSYLTSSSRTESEIDEAPASGSVEQRTSIGQCHFQFDEYYMKRPRRRSSWRRGKWMSCLALVAAVVLGTVIGSIGWSVHSHQQQPQEDESPPNVIEHKERLPTFFSLHDGDDYLYALDNPLYQALSTATFHNDLTTTTTAEVDVEISVSPSSIRSHDEPLRVTWTGSMIEDDDVLVFLCGDSEDELTSSSGSSLGVQEFSDVVEVATFEQIKTTHRLNLQQAQKFGNHQRRSLSSYDADENEWFIPYLPVVRQPVCHFVLYRPRESVPQKRNEQIPTFTDYDFVASSNVLQVMSVLTPTMIHLSAASNNPTEMVVSFTTGGPAGSAGGKPLAVYSPVNNNDVDLSISLNSQQQQEQQQSPLTDERRVTGITTTYTADDLCSAPGNITAPGQFVAPGLLHTVVMTDLTPNAVYQYRVGFQNGQGVTWSDYFTFQAAPTPVGTDNHESDFEPFAFLAYGDQGCPREGWGQGAAWTSAMVANELNSANADKVPVRAVHHFGDLSYAQGHAHQWDEWFQMIQPFAARVPLHVAVGNHEYDYQEGGLGRDPSLGGGDTTDGNGFHPDWGNFENDSGGECGVPTSKRFTMPSSTDTNRPSSNGVFWYSHTFSAVHTIVLSAENDLDYGSPQHAWLVSELATVNRTRTPWLVIEMHRPLYEGEAKWPENNVGIAHRQELEDLFFDYKVDVVLAGHYHAFHRACDGLYQNVCDKGGPLHLTIGTAGALLDVEPLYKNDWSVVLLEKEYGYGRVSVYNRTHMYIEFVRAGAPDDDRAGQVLDDVWVKRDR